MKIRIGIHTDGLPIIHRSDKRVRIENALMGVGFHWQQKYSLLLPSDSELVYHTSSKHSTINLVVTIPLEEYLTSVVSSEMNPDAPLEFIKAHAIIARSWALNALLTQKRNPSDKSLSPVESFSTGYPTFIRIYDSDDHSDFHICNDDHCQRFQGMDFVTDKALRAVRETEGIILTDHHGNLADARYSKCCGGSTELFSTCWQEKDFSYLQPIHDPWCNLSNIEESTREKILKSVLKDYDHITTPDFYSWETFVSYQQISESLLSEFNTDIGYPLSLHPVAVGPSGRISLLRIDGTKGSVVVGKELAIRRLLSPTCLLSSAFTATKTPQGFILTGKGWGHGVGLCQIGAASMAHAGYDATHILQHYYPGIKLSSIDEYLKSNSLLP